MKHASRQNCCLSTLCELNEPAMNYIYIYNYIYTNNTKSQHLFVIGKMEYFSMTFSIKVCTDLLSVESKIVLI